MSPRRSSVTTEINKLSLGRSAAGLDWLRNRALPSHIPNKRGLITLAGDCRK